MTFIKLCASEARNQFEPPPPPSASEKIQPSSVATTPPNIPNPQIFTTSPNQY